MPTDGSIMTFPVPGVKDGIAAIPARAVSSAKVVTSFGCHISPGMLATLLKGCAGELVGAELIIKEGLRQAGVVVGVDETSVRVRQRPDWVHVS